MKILDKLYSYTTKGIKLGLLNIEIILSELDNPDKNYKIIHIAGTNGKGSVATILENVLLENGYNVGKYTSPHLVKFNERIAYNRKEISDNDLEKYFLKIEKIIMKRDIEPSFFDITTAIMFDYFSDKNIDYLVLETGLGGKYDSTNVVQPEVTAITNISHDHSDYLGDTLLEIAEEKAGIIKKNVPVFYSIKKEEIKDVIKSKTENEYDVLLNHHYEIKLNNDDFKTEIKIDNEEYKLPLYGKFQGENFILAYSILKYLKIENKVIKSALKNIKWSGRFELISKDPYIFLDGAHNVDAAKKLKENILSKFSKEEVLVITSILKDKDTENILKEFSKFSNTIICTELKGNLRSQTTEKLKKYAKNFYNKIYEIKEIKDAVKKAKSIENINAIIIAGSLYLVGRFKEGDKNGEKTEE